MSAVERVYHNSSDGEIADTGHSGHTLSCDTHGWSRAGMIRRRLQQCKQHKHTDYSSSLGEPWQQMTTSDQTLLVTVDHDCVAVCCDWLRLRA